MPDDGKRLDALDVVLRAEGNIYIIRGGSLREGKGSRSATVTHPGGFFFERFQIIFLHLFLTSIFFDFGGGWEGFWSPKWLPKSIFGVIFSMFFWYLHFVAFCD